MTGLDERIMEAFGQIRAEEKLKRDTVELVCRMTRRRVTFLCRQWVPAVAACIMLLIAGGGGYSAVFTPISTISVDVNPSFELGINRFDRVVSTVAYNEGGDRVLSGVNVRFMDYRDALDLILADESMARYIDTDQYIAVTVFGRQQGKSDSMLANLLSCTASYANVHCSSGNYSEVAEAHSTGMSCGKYNAYLQLKELEPGITPDEAEGLTMRQIQDRIYMITGGAGTDVGEDTMEYEGTEHGAGHGHQYRHGWGE